MLRSKPVYHLLYEKYNPDRIGIVLPSFIFNKELVSLTLETLQEPRETSSFGIYYFTASFKAFPAVNLGTFIAGILIFCFV